MFPNISFIPFSSLASTTKSSAYAKDHTFSLPTTTHPAYPFLNISSISPINAANRLGLSGQPCLTPLYVLKHSLTLPSTLTLLIVSSYISSIFVTRCSFIPFFLKYSHSKSLSTLSKAAFRSTKNAYILLPLFFYFISYYMIQDIYVVHSPSTFPKSRLPVW
jgi:hypothetical protein